MILEPRRGATPLARSVDLSNAWNVGDDGLAALFDPAYGPGFERAPVGSCTLRGLPFALGPVGGPRWLLVDGPLSIDLPGGPATHLVIAHFCDSWRDDQEIRAPGTPVGWVVPVGETLGRYAVVAADGRRVERTIRRRFEVVDGIIGWGGLPFAAVGHRFDEAVDWRGPHAALGPGRAAPTGHAGPLATLPGAWGPAQTGVADFVPSATDDVTLWLHAIPLGEGFEPVRLDLAPNGPGRPGSALVVAGVTLFTGTADPLVLGARRAILVDGLAAGSLPAVDLGIAIRSRGPERPAPVSGASPTGWGEPSDNADDDATAATAPRAIVDLALAADARLEFDGWSLSAGAIGGTALTAPGGRVTVRALPAPDQRVDVELTSGGASVPARVRFVAADGRYLPPLGHRDEINPGICEDTGADVLLGERAYAYVPGRFAIDLSAGTVDVEVVRGFDHRPVRTQVTIDPSTRRLAFELERPFDLRAGGWRTADSHVHFLAPSTALLQAAAEDLSFIHLLATQWGDHATGVTDLPWGTLADPGGEHRVIMGTENRQVVLGHVGLLGARHPILPMAGGGAPEGRLGAPVTELLSEWSERCRAAGGLTVAAHFPLPWAEVAAAIAGGRIDAVEMQCFPPGLDSPSILEWYRFLNSGHRLPVLGGTDKMSAQVPAGAVRTYARLDPSGAPTFEAWAAAVRAGRTFATSGPVLEIGVDGHEPGDVLRLPSGGGRLDVRARARAAQPIIGALEIVVNGRVVAATEPASASDDVALATTVAVASGSWIAARSRSPHVVHSAFATSMAAHTSPIYAEVPGRPLFVLDDAVAILQVADGAYRWLETMAACPSEADRSRMLALLAANVAPLRARAERTRGGND